MSATIDYDIKRALPFLMNNYRWNVLTVLILHANIRNRCWVSMDTIAEMATHGNRTKANDAKKWLEKHCAFEIVPFSKRVDKERDLAPRQHVYQLLGKIKACDDATCDCNGNGQEYTYLHYPDVDRLNGQTISEGNSLDGQTNNRLNGDTFDRLNGQTGSISIEVLPKKKKTTPPPKKKQTQTPLQKALAQLKPYTVLADAMLSVLEDGYRPGFHTPDTYMTLPHIEDYLPALEYFASKNTTPDEIREMYRYLKPGYDNKGWSIGVKTLVKKLESYRSWKANGGANKNITSVWGQTEAPELQRSGLTQEERDKLIEETRKRREVAS